MGETAHPSDSVKETATGGRSATESEARQKKGIFGGLIAITYGIGAWIRNLFT